MMLFSPRVITAFAVLTCVFLLYSVLSVSSNDPTSLFFNPRTGYQPRYSSFRKEEARNFITTHNNASHPPIDKAGDGRKKLCVGIPSIIREGQEYLRDTVGSLLEGLRPEERAQIYFMVFIPHSDPAKHPAYSQDWLPTLADSVLVYDLPPEDMNHVKEMEKDAGLYREKGIFDYAYLIRKCAEQDTPYIAIFEDDIVAMDGWFHRTLRGILEAEERSIVQRETPDFLYLRLFYTEEFFGWNSEEAGSYLFYSMWVFGILTAVLIYLRNTNPIAQRILTPRTMYIAYGLIITCISLFFALGRATVLPLPNGVNPMPNYGCCSQAFVFQKNKALELADFFNERKVGFVDTLAEDFANERDELRWAVTPSLVQHAGGKSSKVDNEGPESRFGRNAAEKIWSFSFEKYDRELLKLEHEAVANKMKANGGNPKGRP